MKAREKSRLQNSFLRPDAVTSIKRAAGVTDRADEFEEDTSMTEDERYTRSIIALDRRANTNTMRIGGRGGKRVSISFVPNTRESLAHRVPSVSTSSGVLAALSDSTPVERVRSSELDMMSPNPNHPSGMFRRRASSNLGAGRGNFGALRSSLTSPGGILTAVPPDVSGKAFPAATTI
jgi:hypothetical protein